MKKLLLLVPLLLLVSCGNATKEYTQTGHLVEVCGGWYEPYATEKTYCSECDGEYFITGKQFEESSAGLTMLIPSTRCKPPKCSQWHYHSLYYYFIVKGE